MLISPSFQVKDDFDKFDKLNVSDNSDKFKAFIAEQRDNAGMACSVGPKTIFCLALYRRQAELNNAFYTSNFNVTR
jgi:hypothetical protein